MPLRAVLHSTYDETQTGGYDGRQPKAISEAADSAAFFVLGTPYSVRRWIFNKERS